jgi:integrase
VSPSVYIRRRVRRRAVRYIVEFRLGGRESSTRHGGSFPTMKEAQARRNWIAGEIAAMRVPDLGRLAEPSPLQTLSDVIADMSEARPDVGPSAQKHMRVVRQRLPHRLARRPPHEITAAEVRAWTAALVLEELAPSTVGVYLGVLRRAFDHAAVSPNPARLVRAPRVEREEVTPPSYGELQAILEAITPRWRACVVILEGTGLRPDREFGPLTIGDLDLAGGRIRVARTRTKGRTAGRRFVPLLPWVHEALETVLPPPEDRDPAAPVWPGFALSTFRQALARASRHSGLAHYRPYDLRHRFISLLRVAGIPMPLVRQIAGHSKESMTQDTYSHVLLDEPEWRLTELRRAVAVCVGLSPDAGPVPAREPARVPQPEQIPASEEG